MPRLLLVDDNPSIHKIAENLLATSDIELVCVDSAAAALAKVKGGERFDVALLDTAMAGMDGWALLAELRAMPATARIPVAMMAGVLDTVDPARIEAAPIQGFLKKPIDLRELSERVARLMATPVPLPEPPVPPKPVPLPEPPAPPLPTPPKTPSPFATMPAVRIEDLPEFRKKADVPEESLEDVLELTEEDLFPEETAPAAALEAPEESLDLEELDLESLRALPAPVEDVPVVEAASGFPPLDERAEPTPQENAFPLEALDAIATLDRLPENVVTASESPVLPEEKVDLPDLGAGQEDVLELGSLNNLAEIEELQTAEELPLVEAPSLADFIQAPPEEAVFTPPLPPLEESLDWSDDSESMLAAVESPAPSLEEIAPAAPAEPELDLLDLSIPETPEAPATDLPTLPEVVAEPEPAPSLAVGAPLPVEVSTEEVVESAILETADTPISRDEAPAAMPATTLDSKELLNAMMADPAMMDALAKAVVARLGDQALREIAWEVIPELAERLPRN